MKRTKTILYGAVAVVMTVFSQLPVSLCRAANPDSASVSIVNRINASGHITVDEPEALTSRLRKNIQQQSEADSTEKAQAERRNVSQSSRAGFRIQVFDDNNPRSARSEANRYRSLITQRFPEYQAYVVFNSPYWRVKVGDFRSRREAETIMQEIRRAFPALSSYIRVVRDHINIYE